MRIPKRIILSRKGFDTSFGGCASPIFSDGEMISLPIPEETSATGVSTTFGQLRKLSGHSLPEIISSLKPRDSTPWHEMKVHLDPDIRPTLRDRNHREQRGFFGQASGSETILRRGGVGEIENDALFLFYGYFRRVEKDARGYSYARVQQHDPLTHHQHVIWGWLQVGSHHQITPYDDCTHLSNINHHPHLQHRERRNNALYIGRARLSFDESKQGFGVFNRYHSDLRLTCPGEHAKMSYWKTPNFLRTVATGGLQKQWDKQPKNAPSLFYRGYGQEFVFDTSKHPKETLAWLELLYRHASSSEC